MDAIRGMRAAHRRQRRCWRFASAVLDEASWTLQVDGRRIPLEAKPLELLHELLLRAGDVVTKDELLDAVWPGLMVVEASLPTAIMKLRRALGDEKGEGAIIETVPRIGYRLAVPVALDLLPEPGDEIASTENATANDAVLGLPAVPEKSRPRRWPVVAFGLALTLMGGGILALTTAQGPGGGARLLQGQMRDASDAMRRLDVERIEQLLADGWDPTTPYDDQGNGALNQLLAMCEWNPAHDQQKLLLMARTLIDGGARLDTRNVWGDTAYSIASARRYCGPDHPVSRMMHAQCYTGYRPPGDACLADYAHASRR
jgi:DNA-binding winged helix-turn-helix (wHTH) protein